MERDKQSFAIRLKELMPELSARLQPRSEEVTSIAMGLSQPLACLPGRWKIKDRYYKKKQQPGQRLIASPYLKGRAANRSFYSRQSNKDRFQQDNDCIKDEELEKHQIVFQRQIASALARRERQAISYSTTKSSVIERCVSTKSSTPVNSIVKNPSIKSSHEKSPAEEPRRKQEAKKQAPFNYISSVDNMMKKHKAGNVKAIEQKLRLTMSRVGPADSQKQTSIREYNRKCGHPENSKVFVWNSEDEYIRRILLEWGWVHNQAHQSPFFHLKWTYMPMFPEYKVTESQLVNHFRNSHELTSKSYLTKNLKINQGSFGSIQRYYPQCFDVGNPSEQQEFIEEYRKNVMTILLVKLYKHCVLHRPEMMKGFNLFYQKQYKRDLFGEIGRKRKHVLRNRKFRQIEFEDYRNRDNGFLVHLNIVLQALKYWRHFRKSNEILPDEGEHFLAFNKLDFIGSFSQIEKYCLRGDPFTPLDQAGTEFSPQMFGTPSTLLMERVAKEYHFFNQSRTIVEAYGQDNVWIIKPSSTSRGSGIFLTTDLETILSSSKQIQCRIVQKYIERPLLIGGELSGRKFDLRQWVLVKSIDPLQVYMFSECYLRVCYDPYDLSNINNLSSHLTNYSLNKTKFKVKGDSVFPLQFLEKQLLQLHQVSWEQQVKPKIKDLIISSLKSCQEQLDDVNGTCFQLLGYDILIDQYVKYLLTQFNPWLLEVNMSPACEERTPWLSKYLDRMGKGLLQLVLPSQLLSEQMSDVEEDGRTSQWELIHYQNYQINRKRNVEIMLEVTGTKVHLNEERGVDLMMVRQQKAKIIQRYCRKYMPRWRLYRKTMSMKTSIISSYLKQIGPFVHFKQTQKSLSLQTIEVYLQTAPIQKRTRGLMIKRNVGLISNYLKQLHQQKMYLRRKQGYRLEQFKAYARGFALKKALAGMTQDINHIGSKIVLIQRQIRSYLKFRLESKRKLEPYILSFINIQKYQVSKISVEKKYAAEHIESYLSSMLAVRQFEARRKKQKTQIISRYLKSLSSRKEYYRKRFEIFSYVVGRVLRVSRRRARGRHLQEIMQKWRRSKESKNVDALSRYLRAFGAALVFLSLKKR